MFEHGWQPFQEAPMYLVYKDIMRDFHHQSRCDKQRTFCLHYAHDIHLTVENQNVASL